jgi:hypothetical protein
MPGHERPPKPPFVSANYALPVSVLKPMCSRHASHGRCVAHGRVPLHPTHASVCFHVCVSGGCQGHDGRQMEQAVLPTHGRLPAVLSEPGGQGARWMVRYCFSTRAHGVLPLRASSSNGGGCCCALTSPPAPIFIVCNTLTSLFNELRRTQTGQGVRGVCVISPVPWLQDQGGPDCVWWGGGEVICAS